MARLFDTGHRKLEDAGLIDMGARMYDPLSARFITPDSVVPDPMGTQSWARYVYVENNPVNLTDPSGHMPGWMRRQMNVHWSSLCANVK